MRLLSPEGQANNGNLVTHSETEDSFITRHARNEAAPYSLGMQHRIIEGIPVIVLSSNMDPQIDTIRVFTFDQELLSRITMGTDSNIDFEIVSTTTPLHDLIEAHVEFCKAQAENI